MEGHTNQTSEMYVTMNYSLGNYFHKLQSLNKYIKRYETSKRKDIFFCILEQQQWIFHDSESLSLLLNLYPLLSREKIGTPLSLIHVYSILT